jgi:hypothetical protein
LLLVATEDKPFELVCLQVGSQRKRFSGRCFVQSHAEGGRVSFELETVAHSFLWEDVVRKVDFDLPLNLSLEETIALESDTSNFEFERDEALTYATEPNYRGRGLFFCDACCEDVPKEEILLCETCDANVHVCLVKRVVPLFDVSQDDLFFCDALSAKPFSTCARLRKTEVVSNSEEPLGKGQRKSAPPKALSDFHVY